MIPVRSNAPVGKDPLLNSPNAGSSARLNSLGPKFGAFGYNMRVLILRHAPTVLELVKVSNDYVAERHDIPIDQEARYHIHRSH